MEAALKCLIAIVNSGAVVSLRSVDTVEILKTVVGTCLSSPEATSPEVLAAAVELMHALGGKADDAASVVQLMESGAVKRVLKVRVQAPCSLGVLTCPPVYGCRAGCAKARHLHVKPVVYGERDEAVGVGVHWRPRLHRGTKVLGC